MSHDLATDVGLDRIHHQHSHLRSLLARIRKALSGRQASQITMVGYFCELKEHVQSHFVYEERGGFFHEALAEAPHLHGRAAALLEQHPLMIECLEQLHRLANTGNLCERRWTEIAVQFDNFARLFADHEDGENSLLQEAYCEDIGAED